MYIARDWRDYEVIDTGNGEKLERWGHVVLRRPDPLIMWPIEQEDDVWTKVAGRYLRSAAGGGHWEMKQKLPDRWKITYDQLSFYIKPTGFKHTGLFPEQAVNWRWIMDTIRRASTNDSRPIKVLNLFAYTGGATVAALHAGAEVCHVDAAKGMVQWAKENVELSGLNARPVRYITDDVFKFVQREQRRGNTYDAIIMDPPSYGRGPGGEIWKLEKDLFVFLQTCMHILSEQPLFFLINSYTTGFSPSVLHNLMTLTLQRKYGGRITTGEIGLPITRSGLVLPAGILGRWENDK